MSKKQKTDKADKGASGIRCTRWLRGEAMPEVRRGDYLEVVAVRGESLTSYKRRLYAAIQATDESGGHVAGDVRQAEDGDVWCERFGEMAMSRLLWLTEGRPGRTQKARRNWGRALEFIEEATVSQHSFQLLKKEDLRQAVVTLRVCLLEITDWIKQNDKANAEFKAAVEEANSRAKNAERMSGSALRQIKTGKRFCKQFDK